MGPDAIRSNPHSSLFLAPREGAASASSSRSRLADGWVPGGAEDVLGPVGRFVSSSPVSKSAFRSRVFPLRSGSCRLEGTHGCFRCDGSFQTRTRSSRRSHPRPIEETMLVENLQNPTRIGGDGRSVEGSIGRFLCGRRMSTDASVDRSSMSIGRSWWLHRGPRPSCSGPHVSLSSHLPSSNFQAHRFVSSARLLPVCMPTGMRHVSLPPPSVRCSSSRRKVSLPSSPRSPSVRGRGREGVKHGGFPLPGCPVGFRMDLRPHPCRGDGDVSTRPTPVPTLLPPLQDPGTTSRSDRLRAGPGPRAPVPDPGGEGKGGRGRPRGLAMAYRGGGGSMQARSGGHGRTDRSRNHRTRAHGERPDRRHRRTRAHPFQMEDAGEGMDATRSGGTGESTQRIIAKLMREASYSGATGEALMDLHHAHRFRDKELDASPRSTASSDEVKNWCVHRDRTDVRSRNVATNRWTRDGGKDDEERDHTPPRSNRAGTPLPLPPFLQTGKEEGRTPTVHGTLKGNIGRRRSDGRTNDPDPEGRTTRSPRGTPWHTESDRTAWQTYARAGP
eukprot:scaffold616_cov306-Pavlova_lutheri.AAC.13